MFVVLQITFILFHNLYSQIRNRGRRAENNLPLEEELVF